MVLWPGSVNYKRLLIMSLPGRFSKLVFSIDIAHQQHCETFEVRSELRIFFQGDTESTSDYFERLKTLATEIDPQYSENWFQYKFLQKLQSDIRSRLDLDANLSLSDVVRKALSVESNIEQQNIDEKLKQAALKENQNTSTTSTNNLSIRNNIHRAASPNDSSNWNSNIPQYSAHQADHSYSSNSPRNDCLYTSSKNTDRHYQQQISSQYSPHYYHHYENNRDSPFIEK